MKRTFYAAISGTQIFAVVIGLTDGILTALTLASGHLLTGAKPTIALSFRIAVGSAVCGIFVFFTAEYVRLGGELIRAEKQLNLSTRGQFATTQLGKQVRSETFRSALFSSAANFFGALFPLCLGSLMPRPTLLALVPSIFALGILGMALAQVVHGSALTWTAALVASGIALSVLGLWLHIA